MKLSDGYPKPHAKYIVRRDNTLFTATPLYGLHKAGWVVRVMGEKYEAEPEYMLETDEWWPADQFTNPDAAGELVNAVEHLLQFKLELVAHDQRDALLLHSVQAARAALQKLKQGRSSEPSDVGN